MRKSVVIIVGVIAVLSIGACAPHHRWGNSGRGSYGGHMMDGWGRNVPEQSGTPQQVLSEEQLKDAAQNYIDQYLPGYAIERIEQDQWRPIHYVTLKGENDAELQLFINSFNGQVMHVFSVPAE